MTQTRQRAAAPRTNLIPIQLRVDDPLKLRLDAYKRAGESNAAVVCRVLTEFFRERDKSATTVDAQSGIEAT